MKISIIIPTLNGEKYLRKLLPKLLVQEHDKEPPEIIIIDSSSGDNTVATANDFGAMTIVIPKHLFNHSKTRNLASKHSNGDILIFMTQDALPFDNYLIRNLTAPLKTPDIAATYGRHIPKPDASPIEVFARQFSYPETAYIKGIEDIKHNGIRAFRFSNVCSAIKRDIFFNIGMFPEDIRSNEDMIIAAKLILKGYKIAYVPEASVIHSHNLSIFQQFMRYYSIGSSLKNNKWIFKYAQAEKEGIRFIKEQMKFVFRYRKYHWIPYIFLDCLIRYLGYRMGLIAG